MTRLPVSLQSLVIQCLALLLAALLNPLLQIPFSYPPALWQLVLTQGAIAAGLSHFWRQPAWWPPLHFGFLPVILLARQASVPTWSYLAAFLLLVLFYWSSFRTRVPLYLSDRKAWQAVASLLPETQAFRFIDLGSGLGGVPLYLAPRFPQGRFYGTETAPAPWLISRLRAGFNRSRVRFMRRDYATLDLADFDVVFAFLSPAAMPALWLQAQAQMRSGSLFISLSFAVGTRPPDHVLTLAEGARHTLYAWRM
ncbi:MAG: class I SAM-dependent methyltransferase [Gammaproteobacteria bacterium]|nr:class I SAM-dependent methyltransferase [Gammaproteobacteria bacterium]